LKLLRILPAYAINGISVALGMGLLQLLASALAGPHAALLVLSGAICASLADLPNPAVRTWHRVSAAALLSVLSAAVVELLKPHPVALGGAIAVIAFVAMMTMAWGVRAGPVAFAPIIAVVFSMASPPARGAFLSITGWHAVGGGAYVGWSLLCAWALQRRYRRLALAEALDSAAHVLRARAELISAPHSGGDLRSAMRDWVLGEAELAERLQTARDFVFAGAARRRREAALLLAAIDLRDVLLASRLDLELLGDDAPARWMLAQTGTALRQIARALDGTVQILRFGRRTEPESDAAAPAVFEFDTLFVDPPMAADDPRARLLPALALRLRILGEITTRMSTLLQGQVEPLPLTPKQLRRFVSPEGWPLEALRSQLRKDSPVARHALRTALALGTAYFIGRALPWASHPHWLVLSVAVVLRGNLEQTLSRRNARVGGTLLGCVVVVLLSRVLPPPMLALVFLLAIGTAHAFVIKRYWVAASAATVMALLQSYAVNPSGGFAVGERAGDTLLGAVLAWAFSYVLPSWERSSLPGAMRNTLKALGDYAGHSLRWPQADAVEPRLARRRAYDALSALAGALQRSRAEPRGVQVPVPEVAALIDHGQRLMAHLSVVRMILSRGTEVLDTQAAVAALTQAQAELRRSLDPGVPPPTGPLPARTLPAIEELKVLPFEAPSDDLLPWLTRRLDGLTRDARLIRDAAGAATTALEAPGATAAKLTPGPGV
jgi:uncharacterized membrane protein YccC